MGIKLYLDIPASQVLSPSLPAWGRGEGSGWKVLPGKRNRDKASCPQIPTPLFQERVEERNQCPPRGYSVPDEALGALPAFISFPTTTLRGRA